MTNEERIDELRARLTRQIINPCCDNPEPRMPRLLGPHGQVTVTDCVNCGTKLRFGQSIAIGPSLQEAMAWDIDHGFSFPTDGVVW